MKPELMDKTMANSETSTFAIEGMTCQACVKTVTEKISEIPNVTAVDVNLEKKNVTILASRKINLQEVASALSKSPKYTVAAFVNQTHSTAEEKSVSVLQTYKPLLIIFTFIILVSLAYQISLDTFNTHLFMNHIMAGFFIGLSFFKFLDLPAFAESFSSYDPLAQKWLYYGRIYPFVELFLGLLFIAGKSLLFANYATVLVLSLTTYGVYKRLQAKNKIQCACLGTTFSLPLSNVTIAENIVMILMAVYSLVEM